MSSTFLMDESKASIDKMPRSVKDIRVHVVSLNILTAIVGITADQVKLKMKRNTCE